MMNRCSCKNARKLSSESVGGEYTTNCDCKKRVACWLLLALGVQCSETSSSAFFKAELRQHLLEALVLEEEETGLDHGDYFYI
jgi:hypothetical protein